MRKRLNVILLHLLNISVDYLKQLPEGCLESVIKFARAGKISLHRQVM